MFLVLLVLVLLSFRTQKKRFSDGFFELTEQPERVAVVGAGYIAVELTGIFNALGTNSHLFLRHERAMRTLDPLLSEMLDVEVFCA